MERFLTSTTRQNNLCLVLSFLILPSLGISLDKSTRSLLTSNVLDLPLSSFEDDLLLLQEMSFSSSSFSVSYVLPSSGTPIFVQNSTEGLNKPVIILESGEDRLPEYENKKLFIVLRQAPQPYRDLYWVLMAYLRDTPDGRKVEWDIWDDRSHASHFNKASLFGWTSCGSSSVVPCKSHSLPEGEGFELHKTPPPSTSSICFFSSKRYLNSSSSRSSHLQLLEFFSDIPPFGSQASLAGLIIDAMVFARSTYALLLPQYSSLRPTTPPRPFPAEAPPLCEESNDLDDPEACPPGFSYTPESSNAIFTSKTLLDIKVNDIGSQALGSQALGSSLPSLLQSGHNFSTINTAGKSLLQGLLATPNTEKTRVLRLPYQNTESQDLRSLRLIYPAFSVPHRRREIKSVRVLRYPLSNTDTPDSTDSSDSSSSSESQNPSPFSKINYLPSVTGISSESDISEEQTLPSPSPQSLPPALNTEGEHRSNPEMWVMETEADLFTNLGWTSGKIEEEIRNFYPENEEEKEQILQRIAGPIFQGIGGCPGGNVSLKKLESLEKPEEILNFYVKAMGIHCIPFMRQRVIKLLRKGHLFVTSRKTLWVNSDLQNKKKLSKEEMEQLSLLVEMATFSRNLEVFLKLTKKMRVGPIIRGLFIKTFALDFTRVANKHFPLHAVKLRRNLLRTLTSLLTKSLQDVFSVQYRYCDNCFFTKVKVALAKEEPFEILGLIGFLSSEDSKSLSFAQLYKELSFWVWSHRRHLTNIYAQFFKSIE